ncbi:hypothetical protein N0Y54_06680 [Nostoc punctiforme UO1]|uniref:hypothetical protein n=1 Tax=Nostoc punctiforme TaxID=272131 RepID=UPI00309DBCCB
MVYQYGLVKGERRKGKGFEYILSPSPLTLSPDHKESEKAYPNRIEWCTTRHRRS